MWVNGSYNSECSYSILDVFGDVIVSGTGAMTTTNYTVDCGLSACPKPNNLVVTETTGTTTTLSWTENGTATAWQICLNDDETNLINVTTNPYTLTGLTAEAAYTAKVRANCGDEQSSWSNTVSFMTSDKMVIGSGTSTSNTLPLNNYYNYTVTQQIYTTAELGAAGNILSVDFYKNNTVVCSRNIDIYMVSTSKNSFTGTSDWITVTDNDKVFSGTVNFVDNDWTTITLDTPFEYDGTNNVAIVVDDNTGTYKSNTTFLTYTTSSNQAHYCYQDGTNMNPSNPSGSNNSCVTSKNQIRVLFDRSEPCNAPTELNVSEIDHQSAVISWEGEADTWRVLYKSLAASEYTEVTTTDNSYTMTNLSPETEYIVVVLALCGDETAGSESSFITLPLPCPAPTEVMVTEVNRNSAVVSWTEAGDATSWVVAYRSDIDELFTEVEVSEPTYTLSDLTEGTLYVVKVRPVCEGVTNSWSNPVRFTTESCHTISLSADEPSWTENFDSYVQSTTAATGTEPDCWELVRTDATSMPNDKRPQVYYRSDFAHSGSYSLLLNYRGVYAMPAMAEDVTIQDVKLEMYLRQANAAYQLEVGVWDDATNTFMPVALFNNATTGVEQVMCDFSGYTGNGRRIAFRNVLGSGKTWNYSYNYLDDITLTLLGLDDCTVSLSHTETFEDYTAVTTAATGTEPDCWELVQEDVQMPDNKKPQLYYRSDFAHSGNYSLLLNYRGVYAMPNLDAVDANISDLHLSMYLRQPNAAYTLEVGVWEPGDDSEETGVFVPVHVFNNKTTDVTFVECDFSNYTGNGGRIAFRNTLTSGKTWSYSYNYLDDITLDYAVAAKGAASDESVIDAMAADLDQVDVVVYPNPTKDVVNVQCTMNNVQCSGIEIVDVYGKTITTVGTRFIASAQFPTSAQFPASAPTQINVSGLAAGMYFVRVTTDRGVVTKPFVKR